MDCSIVLVKNGVTFEAELEEIFCFKDIMINTICK